MNKRIKKKNDIVRMYAIMYREIDAVDKYMSTYARLVGRKDHLNANEDFWRGYDKWNKSISGHRTWAYISKKCNISKSNAE